MLINELISSSAKVRASCEKGAFGMMNCVFCKIKTGEIASGRSPAYETLFVKNILFSEIFIVINIFFLSSDRETVEESTLNFKYPLFL